MEKFLPKIINVIFSRQRIGGCWSSNNNIPWLIFPPSWSLVMSSHITHAQLSNIHPLAHILGNLREIRECKYNFDIVNIDLLLRIINVADNYNEDGTEN